MKARIGYLVPEFPGQTHTWIWRDRRALEELGIEADLVSTRRPKLVIHDWAEKAQQLTHYLVPLSPHDVREALTALLRATSAVTLSPTELATRETAPLGGYARAPVILCERSSAHR